MYCFIDFCSPPLLLIRLNMILSSGSYSHIILAKTNLKQPAIGVSTGRAAHSNVRNQSFPLTNVRVNADKIAPGAKYLWDRPRHYENHAVGILCVYTDFVSYIVRLYRFCHCPREREQNQNERYGLATYIPIFSAGNHTKIL